MCVPFLNLSRGSLHKYVIAGVKWAAMRGASGLARRRQGSRRQAMSYSNSTLILRNLRDVFGENDPARRRAAIDELYNEDGVFYDPTKGAIVAATRSIASRARSRR